MKQKSLSALLCILSFLAFALSTSAISIEEATTQYIYTLYQKQRYTDVTVEARNFLGRYPMASSYATVAILGGEAAYKDKNYHLGRYFFEQAFKKTKNPPQVKQSLLGMAKCSYKLGLYEEAARLFESYAREFDDPVVTPAVLYYAQVCALAAGDHENAQRYRQWHTSRYPESPYLSLLASPSSTPPEDTQPAIQSSPTPLAQAKESPKPQPPLNEVPFSMPSLPSTETTNLIILTNWVTLTTTNVFTNQQTSPKGQTLPTMEENARYLSLLEVKAKLLQLKARTLDDELSELGIGGLE